VPLDALGYSSLPINLVEAGFQQLQKIPGNQVPAETQAEIQGCHNPTFSTTGVNTLAETDPYPPACDKQGPTQCTTGTGGARTSTPVSPNASGSSPTGTSATAGAGAGAGTGQGTGKGTGTSSADSAAEDCSPDSGTCSATTPDSQSAQTVNAVPVGSPVSLGDAVQVVLMGLAAALLVGLIVTPPLIAQASRRRRQRGSAGRPGGPGAFL